MVLFLVAAAVGAGGAALGPGPASVAGAADVHAASPMPGPRLAGTLRSSGSSGSVTWLCRPGAANDPCAFTRAATSIAASGDRSAAGLSGVHAPGDQRFDCFFVYPTVSTEHGANANLKVQTNEVGVAIDEASQFSQVCTVWAPMYRQATAQAVSGLGAHHVSATLVKAEQVAYASLLSAWRSFLVHDDHGRPVVLIGHSQGAVLLIKLIAAQIDPVASLRKKLVVALLAGGNVQVPTGRVVGGSFKHVPLCTALAQAGCVVAWSSFPSTPPATTLFGRPGQGVSLQGGQTVTSGQQVACVNPADIGGGTAPLDDYFLREVEKVTPPVNTQWLTFPDLYTGTCEHASGATWLQVDDVAAAGDTRPTVTESAGPDWGYHADDISLVLGNLVQDVAAEEAAWVAARH